MHRPPPQRGDPYFYDDFNADEYQTQQQASLYQSASTDDETESTTTDGDDETHEEDSESDGWISTESSLLAGEGWDDDSIYAHGYSL